MQSSLLTMEREGSPAKRNELDGEPGSSLSIRGVPEFEALLAQLTGLERRLSAPVHEALDSVLRRLPPTEVSRRHVTSRFYGLLNQKLEANRPVLREIYGFAASRNVTLNYPTRVAIAWAVNSADREAFARVLSALADAETLRGLEERFRPVPFSVTRELIVEEAAKPTKLRKAHDRDVVLDVYEAAAGPLLWSLWPVEALHDVFQPPRAERRYTGDYMTDLRADHPALFDRGRALVVRSARPDRASYASCRRQLAGWVQAEYERLNNYGYLAVVIDTAEDAAAAWELSADVTLFAERFNERPLSKQYFRSDAIARETVAHIPSLDLDAARFDLVSEGFTYRDLFVLTDRDGAAARLVVLFQKNKRDETLVPCPACRCTDVRGNSYPSLGVKSWECVNPLCPDRSIYNRGKRYSFKALVSQAAIEHPENAIPVESVRRWQRDVVPFADDADIYDMLTRHYSMTGDTVVFVDPAEADVPDIGRRVVREPPRPEPAPDFWHEAAFFRRYVAEAPARVRTHARTVSERWEVLEGDARTVLSGFEDDTFDRAITSPPYYNAREYAQWPNLYCYLRDMQRINEQVYRTLKPGAVYAYNIFDYFDNERTVTFSAMGQKRIALSALMVDLFRRIGFTVEGAAAWDKGEIQGKRGFNSGNFSPFYQAPFNCWEHVLLLRKPGPAPGVAPSANQVLRVGPVIKMVRGQNTFGHTAPYPLDLVRPFLGGLEPGAVVLDPFGGSGTTGRAALEAGLRSVMVERDPEYVALSRRLLAEQESADGARQTLW